ncbi:hypothetical protein B1A_14149 [mine drainage metagenome]|uniref:Uncharacterized protein n=1 Tax=mine drainage metagenome TaxID=410659 RepID=T1B1G3_9ZZZZ
MRKKNVTISVNYRLNFDAERHCGYIKVYHGTDVNYDEDFELYLELLTCGLNEIEVESRAAKLISEIENRNIDVSI